MKWICYRLHTHTNVCEKKLSNSAKKYIDTRLISTNVDECHKPGLAVIKSDGVSITIEFECA
jgi:hypothetical protein